MPQVLVVDDEKNVLTTLSIGLKRYDYTVKKAQSGPEALRVMEEDPCEMVVSDVRMSPMDGYTLASRIREKYPWVGVVLMSAYGFEEEPSGQNGSVGFPRLTKPFDVSELVRVLQKEEKKSSKGGILVVGEEEGEELKRILESAGFWVEVLDSKVNLKERIRNVYYDLFLIDEAFLDEKKWKVLNEIDRWAPGKPVILLTKNSGKRERATIPDLSVTVLDKAAFFEDRDWAVELLQESMGRV